MKTKELYPLTLIKQFDAGEFHELDVMIKCIETEHDRIYITTTLHRDNSTSITTCVVTKGGNRE